MSQGLERLGWDGFFEEQLTHKDRKRGQPGRIIEAFRKRFLVHTGERVVWALARGAMFHRASSRTQLPAVGDFCVIEFANPQDPDSARLWRLLERRTQLVRQAAGEQTKPQVIAANIDTIFVVTSLNQDFNTRRLERYLALVEESGARGVVVLNKSDLCEDRAPFLARVDELAPGMPVVVTSMKDHSGVEALRAHSEPGQTVALIGSSGVGKSTLINELAGDQVQATGATRQGDGKGRHTTTTRQLVVMPDDSLLIDTPGMRELGLWQVDSSALQAFADVEAAGVACKFRDCLHEGEAGCAVQEAVAAGELEQRRVEGWQKLKLEIEHAQQRQTELERLQKRRGSAASKRSKQP